MIDGVVDSVQLGFIDFVVFPLYESFAKYVHPDIANIMETLEQNRQQQVEQTKIVQAPRAISKS